MKNPYRKLEKRLGYTFRRKKRLRMALTHRSYRYENPDTDMDNQRLEFLGDAALGLVAAACLYELNPDMQEGELTKLRSHVTSSKGLARVAEGIELGEWLELGRGEQQSGGHQRASNLTDAFEAVLGAAYLDGGLKAVRKIFKKLIGPIISDPPDVEVEDNPKGMLQELSQRRWKITPKYKLVREDGPSHDRQFTVEVSLRGHNFGSGTGSNKQAAEMEAARMAFRDVTALETLPPKKKREETEAGVTGPS